MWSSFFLFSLSEEMLEFETLLKIEYNMIEKYGIAGGQWTYKDIELPIESRGDGTNQLLPVVLGTEVTNRATDRKPFTFPFFYPLVELFLVAWTCIHSCPKSCQFFNNRKSGSSKTVISYLRIETGKNYKGRREIKKRTNPMPLVPPVTSAVIPLRDHLCSLQPISVSAMIIFVYHYFYFIYSSNVW